MGAPRILRLLRTLSWRSYRATPARLALVIGGIAAGVALLVAIGLINASVLTNFRTMLERTAGKAALQIELGTGEIGFDEATVAVAEADPDVEHAFGMVRGTLHASDGSGEVLQLFGVDLVSDAIDSYDVRVTGGGDALELLNDPDSVLIGEAYADRSGLAVGSRVRFATPTGVRELHVRGLLEASGLATVFGGNLAIMDLPAAQMVFGKDGRVDQIDLLLAPGRVGGGGAGAIDRRPALVALGQSAGAARRAHRTRDRGVSVDARRLEPALPAGQRVHRLQHDGYRRHRARPRSRRAAHGRASSRGGSSAW